MSGASDQFAFRRAPLTRPSGRCQKIWRGYAGAMMQRRDFFRLMAAAGLLPLAKTHAAEAPPPKDDPQFWRWVRAQLEIPADEAYFNTGTLGAIPKVVTQAVADSMHQIERTMAHFDYRP